MEKDNIDLFNTSSNYKENSTMCEDPYNSVNYSIFTKDKICPEKSECAHSIFIDEHGSKCSLRKKKERATLFKVLAVVCTITVIINLGKIVNKKVLVNSNKEVIAESTKETKVSDLGLMIGSRVSEELFLKRLLTNSKKVSVDSANNIVEEQTGIDKDLINIEESSDIRLLNSLDSNAIIGYLSKSNFLYEQNGSSFRIKDKIRADKDIFISDDGMTKNIIFDNKRVELFSYFNNENKEIIKVRKDDIGDFLGTKFESLGNFGYLQKYSGTWYLRLIDILETESKEKYILDYFIVFLNGKNRVFLSPSTIVSKLEGNNKLILKDYPIGEIEKVETSIKIPSSIKDILGNIEEGDFVLKSNIEIKNLINYVKEILHNDYYN